jgi:hypothetical protein
MSYEGSMMGSGIYSEEVTLEVVCKESCNDCMEANKVCEMYWDEDFHTDDWGNIEQTVTCKACNHSYTIKREAE